AARVYAGEVASGAPVASSLAAGAPVGVAFTPTFVDGIGSPRVFPEMFELARTLLDGSLVVEPDAAADAVRLRAARAHVVGEGAGAVPVAAATAGLAGPGKVVAIVSGGSIDASKLATILAGGSWGRPARCGGGRRHRVRTARDRTPPAPPFEAGGCPDDLGVPQR